MAYSSWLIAPMNKKAVRWVRSMNLNQTFNNIKGHPKKLSGWHNSSDCKFIYFLHSLFTQVIEPTIHTPISGLLPQNAISNGYSKQGAAVL
jgi:type VI protein secretion system component VasK